MADGLRIAIIGAGATGMAAAWDLVRAGHKPILFEGQAQVGGLAGGFRDENWEWSLEKFYHHWFTSDADVMGLIEEIGYSDKVIARGQKTSYWLNGKLFQVEVSLRHAPFLVWKLPLSFMAIVRMGLAGVYLKLTKNWQPLEKHTIDDWMRRYMGDEAYEKLWRPLIIGKFADRYKEVNMAWLWSRIYKRTPQLATFEGGFQAFLDTLADAIKARGAEIRLNTRVDEILIENEKPVLVINGEKHEFDRVISTMSPRQMLKMAPALVNMPYGKQMEALDSIGAVCLVLALDRQFMKDGTYWLNLPSTTPDKKQSQFPFLALVEHTNWMDKEHYNGDHLLYLGDYVPADHEYFTMSDKDLTMRFVSILPRFNQDFNPSWIRKSWLFKAPYAQPVPGINHSAKIPPLVTPLPGVYWASMSQVYPWDRGTNYSVEMGRRVAQIILKQDWQ
ncbi:MAG: NAD(P)/FAD-dependent oxidoreductase [Burkholderiales bacterium]|nr:NAD(P)/FAD-dependent oxidoreductase [Anaerolineae bacterium]